MITTPYDKYRQAQAQTVNGSKLVIMLYEGAIRFTKLGIEGIDNKNIEQANNNLIKAQAIINELVATLNFDYEISKQLVQLYEYMLHLLIQSNLRKSTSEAEEVVTLLTELKEAWVTISKSGDATTHAGANRA
ncbi:flagellar export chaperone FliS [Paenibacillus sp. MY03]|uniref:flagellar export chaperone FliS n=1 Tax=Paenibacillus TaxID=44249 RepID=UPI000B3C4C3D|nr:MULTISPECIES: flagellar export chaperone FliS [Paenibacillus]OUS75143.1 flagellar export chaperone FliS [Paenibacillus sp. MY03]